MNGISAAIAKNRPAMGDILDEYPSAETVEKAIEIGDLMTLKGWYAFLRMAENDDERKLINRITAAILVMEKES